MSTSKSKRNPQPDPIEMHRASLEEWQRQLKMLMVQAALLRKSAHKFIHHFSDKLVDGIAADLGTLTFHLQQSTIWSYEVAQVRPLVDIRRKELHEYQQWERELDHYAVYEQSTKTACFPDLSGLSSQLIRAFYLAQLDSFDEEECQEYRAYDELAVVLEKAKTPARCVQFAYNKAISLIREELKQPNRTDDIGTAIMIYVDFVLQHEETQEKKQ